MKKGGVAACTSLFPLTGGLEKAHKIVGPISHSFGEQETSAGMSKALNKPNHQPQKIIPDDGGRHWISYVVELGANVHGG